MYVLNYAKKSHSDLPPPPGYLPHIKRPTSETSQQKDLNLLDRKSWDVATGPLKQIPMNMFIMYMAGNSVSIIPIMMVGMLFVRAIKALMAVKSVEGQFVKKLVYVFGNLLCIALALYKCQSMGVLPTHSSDWLDFLENPKRVEYISAGFKMSG